MATVNTSDIEIKGGKVGAHFPGCDGAAFMTAAEARQWAQLLSAGADAVEALETARSKSTVVNVSTAGLSAK